LRRTVNEVKESVEQEDTTQDAERLEREMARIERRRQRREERKQNGGVEAKSEPQPEKKKLPLEQGAKVRLMGQDGVGVVQSIRGKKAQVAFGQMLTTVDASRLEEFRRPNINVRHVPLHRVQLFRRIFRNAA
jgi:DNA mismatch repair protein MutS2